MFGILTIVTAVWFAIIALILANLIRQVPNPRIRIILPFVCGVLLGLVIIMYNPGLVSGYRGQTEYLGPFLFPVLVPLFVSVPLIFFWQREDVINGEIAEFSGSLISAFLFLILYQSKFFSSNFQDFVASSLLIGSALVIPSFVFFIIEKARPVLPGWAGEWLINPAEKSIRKKPQADLKLMGLLAICLLASLSPLYVMDFLNNHDRATMGQLYLYHPDPSRAPEGTVIHITEEQLREYPQLVSLIKKPRVSEFGDSVTIEKKAVNATDLGNVFISCDTESRMRNDGIIYTGSMPAIYFESGGDLYLVKVMHYAGEECVEVSFFS
jgi:hypothetical protein